MKKLDIEYTKRWIELESTRDIIYCSSKVCKKCDELIDTSDEFQFVYRCPYSLDTFYNLDNFQDMEVPQSCNYRLEHMVMKNQIPKCKTKMQVIEEMEDEMIYKMDEEHYGEN